MTVIGPATLLPAVQGPSRALATAAQAQQSAVAGGPAAQAPPAPAASPVAAMPQPVAEAALRLVPQQGGLAPLFADLDTGIGRADLPPAVRNAAQAVLSLRVGVPDAAAVKSAMLASGLFNEAMLASGTTPGGDLKSALLSLRQTLQSWLGSARPEPAAASSLPPPYRGATPIAQQPVPPSIALLDPPAAGARLLAETDAALARHTLLQIASLPDAAAPQQQTDAPPRLTFDIPIATAQGTAVIQLQVERDDARKSADGEAEAPAWRINVAIDVEPLGPVRATVAQAGGQTHVALFAERKEAARALRDDLPALQAALAEAALEPGDLVCRTGLPQVAPAGAGLFVDRAS